VRAFKTKAFTRFADKAGLFDDVLCRAAEDAGRGFAAAELLAHDEKMLSESSRRECWWR
jgi:hypothetical protein